MAHGLLEHKTWGAHLGSIVSDVVEEFRPLDDPSDVVAEIIGDISMQLILCSNPERYVKIGIGTADGTTDRITATFLFDQFRRDLTSAAYEGLAGGHDVPSICLDGTLTFRQVFRRLFAPGSSLHVCPPATVPPSDETGVESPEREWSQSLDPDRQ